MSQIDYEQLSKEELIDHLKRAKRDKRFGLIWEEKPEQVDKLLEEHFPVLSNLPEKDILIDSEKPVNLLIEGDNLHSLYLLNTTHRNSVDCMLIDPPYNTGNKDFIYNDQYIDKKDAWRHSKWISFMNRRLQLARHLLKEDGVLFIHIDENEFAQLKLLCDEIFGYDNCLGIFIWKARSGKGGTNSQVAHEHEYIYCYAKNSEMAKLKTIEKVGEKRLENLRQWGQAYLRQDRPYMFYPILFDSKRNQLSTATEEEFRGLYDATTRTFNDTLLEELREKYEAEGWTFILPIREEGYGRWRVGYETLRDDLIPKKELIVQEEKGEYKVKRMFEEGNVTESAMGSLILDKGTASDGTKELKKIFKTKIFDTTKPIDTTQFLIDLAMYRKQKGIVMDFFAGSGTTGETVMRYNEEEGKQIQFILCTNNEMKQEIKFKLERQGIPEDSDEYQNEGVCRKVTFPKLKAIIEGFEYKGQEKELLDDVKLNITALRRMDVVLTKMEETKQSVRDKYDRFEQKVVGEKLELWGIRDINGKTDALPNNLKYYMTDVIPKSTNRDQMKVVMAQRIYDLLCIKENCFERVVNEPFYQIYRHGKKVVGIYSDFLNTHFEDFKQTMVSMEAEEKVLYSFSFSDVMDVSLIEDMPSTIYIKTIPTQIIEMLQELKK